MTRVPRVRGVGRLLACVAVALPLSASGQPPLADAAARFASAWAEGDVEALARAMLGEGIRYHVGGERHVRLGVRQARASLADLIGENPGGLLRVRRVSSLGGEPVRGFAEFSWAVAKAVPEGRSERTVFVGFSWDGDRWRVSEIRVF